MYFFFVVDDHSINMLQYEITVLDSARLKLTPALFSLKKQKQKKKNTQVLSVSFTSLSIPLAVCVRVCL